MCQVSIPREFHQFCSLSWNGASNLSFFPSLRYNKLNRQWNFASLLIFYERSGICNSVQFLLSDFKSPNIQRLQCYNGKRTEREGRDNVNTPLLCILAQFICLFVSDNKEMTGVNHIYIRSHGNCMSNETLSFCRVTLNFLAWLVPYVGPSQTAAQQNKTRKALCHEDIFFFSSILCWMIIITLLSAFTHAPWL